MQSGANKIRENARYLITLNKQFWKLLDGDIVSYFDIQNTQIAGKLERRSPMTQFVVIILLAKLIILK